MPTLMLSVAHDITEPDASQPSEDFREECGEVMMLSWRVHNHPLIDEGLEEPAGSQNKKLLRDGKANYLTWSVGIAYVSIAVPPKMGSDYVLIKNKAELNVKSSGTWIWTQSSSLKHCHTAFFLMPLLSPGLCPQFSPSISLSLIGLFMPWHTHKSPLDSLY